MFWVFTDGLLQPIFVLSNTQKQKHMKKLLMNLQGFTFTVEKAKEFYGERFETAILAKVIVDEDGNTVGSWG